MTVTAEDLAATAGPAKRYAAMYHPQENADAIPATMVLASDYDAALEHVAALMLERDEWRKQTGIGVQSQWDEGVKYETRIKNYEALVDDARATIERLRGALEQSVQLQSHYAYLLNAHDGGERIGFASAEKWLERLAALAPPSSVPQKGNV